MKVVLIEDSGEMFTDAADRVSMLRKFGVVVLQDVIVVGGARFFGGGEVDYARLVMEFYELRADVDPPHHLACPCGTYRAEIGMWTWVGSWGKRDAARLLQGSVHAALKLQAVEMHPTI